MTELAILEAQPDELGQLALIERALRVLNDHYPAGETAGGHHWQVGMTDGLLLIRLAVLRGQYQFAIHPRDYDGDPGLRCVMRAGGEMLERHNIARGARTESTYDPRRIGLMQAEVPEQFKPKVAGRVVV